MSANRSAAVMQQKRGGDAPQRGRLVAPPPLNYFPTPPWATRALCEFLIRQGLPLDDLTCWEPACGEMHMVRPLEEYSRDVIGTDVHRYGGDHEIFDFVGLCGAATHANRAALCDQPDFVITNPPFTLASEFIAASSAIARHGFAMLTRSAFLEGADRHQRLWSKNPPSFVLQFSERVVMLEGRLVRAGAVDPFSEDADHRARSATAYVWLVWLEAAAGAATGPSDAALPNDTRLRWIGPCRARLERASDYPDYAAEVPRGANEGLFAEEGVEPGNFQQEEAA